MMTHPPLILASASPRRSDLLHQMGLLFQVIPSNASEILCNQFTPHELSRLNAFRKAHLIARQNPDSLVLGADTLVCLGREFFGKPDTINDAHRMLTRLQGQCHQVVTGVCLIHHRAHRQQSFADSTDVTFRSLTPRQIEQYLERINPLDKAGAYAIQDHGEWIVERIDGSYSNVVGLPTEHLQSMLAAWPIPATNRWKSTGITA